MDLFVILLILAGSAASIYLNKLTGIAAIAGAILSTLIFKASGVAGLSFIAAFFIIGNWVTSCRFNQKLKNGLAEKGKGKRKAGQVLANAGMAGIISLVAMSFPQIQQFAPVLIAACFSSATADTVSSELGNLYGKKYFEILNFRKGKRGENGVISLEGTLLGMVGSCIIGIIFILFYQQWQFFIAIIIAGTIGNFSDSIFGASLEKNKIIGNNMVNFLNTLVATAVAWVML